MTLKTGVMNSLQLRFMLVVIAGASIFALFAGSIAYRVAHERALANGRATIEGLVDAVEKTTAIGAFASDRVLLNEVIDGLARNPLVAHVGVLSASGVLLVQRVVTAEQQPGAGRVRIERRLISPFDEFESVGALLIDADPERLEAGARGEAARMAALMVVQTALVALLLYAVEARLVSRPIVHLSGRMRAMQPGSSERLLLPAGHVHDEIGALVNSANALLEGNHAALQRERQLRAAIEKMEAQYRQIFDSSSAGIFVLDPEGRLINGNPTALKVIGLSVDAMRRLQGKDFVAQVFARPERVQEMVREAAERGETVSADVELLRPGAVPRWVHCLISVQAVAGEPSLHAGSVRSGLIEGVMYDITERKRAEGAVQHQAEHDGLTGLKNRGSSEVTIERYVAEASSSNSEVTVLYIDLDGFKAINDSMGHKAGDLVLQACSRRMQAVVRRASDLVGRMGGDEFVVALSNVGSADPLASNTARALLDALCEPIALDDGRTTSVGASIGMACYPRHGSTRKQLLHSADAAMYEVKRSGKNAFAMMLGASAIA